MFWRKKTIRNLIKKNSRVIERRAAGCVKLFVIFALMVFFPIKGLAQDSCDYTVNVGNERLYFVQRPELGYVVKAQQDSVAIEALDNTLRDFGAEDIRPVRGLDRKGVAVVYSERSASENESIIQMLSARSEIRYATPLFSSNDEPVAIIPEIVVQVTSETDVEQLQNLCETMGLAIKKRMEFTDVEYLIEVFGSDSDAVFSAVEQLNKTSFIEWACPNAAFQPQLCGQVIPNQVTPNDEYFLEQWHLHNIGQITRLGSQGMIDADINAPEAWEITTGDPNIIIAVPDTGVDTNNPDLINNLVAGYDFLDDDNSPDPSNMGVIDPHGTGCAGLVSAHGNNGIGVTGVTWNCKIMPIRIEAQDRLCTDADIATAFRWMANNGADVITNSWGWGYAVPITHSAIIDITQSGGIGRDGKGCVVLGASGNAGTSSVMYIARYPEVIAVGATDNRDQRWYYSNYGPDLNIVAPSGGRRVEDIPGGFLCTTDISGSAGVNNEWLPDVYGPLVNIGLDYRVCMGGTSGACPVATGVVALILSVDPNLTSLEVQDILQQSARDLGAPGRDDYYGHGRVDARAALDLVLKRLVDFDRNGKVDFKDYAKLAQHWIQDDPSVDIAPPPNGDGIVDYRDLAVLTDYWLEDNNP